MSEIFGQVNEKTKQNRHHSRLIGYPVYEYQYQKITNIQTTVFLAAEVAEMPRVWWMPDRTHPVAIATAASAVPVQRVGGSKWVSNASHGTINPCHLRQVAWQTSRHSSYACSRSRRTLFVVDFLRFWKQHNTYCCRNDVDLSHFMHISWIMPVLIAINY